MRPKKTIRHRRTLSATALALAWIPGVLCALEVHAPAQDVGTEWRTDIGFSTAYAPAFSGHHAIDSQGNVYATSNALSYSTAKLSPTGEHLWTRSEVGGSGTQSLHLAIDSQDNCVVAGYQEGLGGGFLTTKYDPDGNKLWSVITLHGTKDEGFRIGVDAADNVYVAGRSLSPLIKNRFLTIKFDPDGNELWFRHFQQQQLQSEPRAIAVAPDGRVAVTGSFGSNFGTACYDTDGNLLWSDSFPGIAGAEHLAMSDAGDVYVCGTGIVSDELIGAVVHYDPSGQVVWVGTHNTPSLGWDRFRRVALHSDGSVVATGQGGPGYQSISTVKFDASGAMVWADLVPDTNSNDGWGTDVVLDAGGTAYVTGFKSYQTFSSGLHTVALKYDSVGNLLWMDELACTGYSGSIALADAPGGSDSVIVSSGSHVVRVGDEPIPISTAVSPNPAPTGSTIALTFRAYDYTGAMYVAAAAFGTTPGIETPHGTFPLNADPLFFLSVAALNETFSGFSGLMPCVGEAEASIQVPADPALSGLAFYVAFAAVPNVFGPPPWGLSEATLVQIL